MKLDLIAEEIIVTRYPVLLRPLTDDEGGGGWLAEVPDLPGCMADGETEAEALVEVERAIEEWKAAAMELGRPIPEPSKTERQERYSGKWVQRVPKSLHRKLAREAEREGVSLNSLATALIAEGLGKKLVAA